MRDEQRDLMSNIQQQTLTERLNALFKGYREQHKLSPMAVLYFLVSYTWGWARGCGWSSRDLVNYNMRAYTACDKRENAESGNGFILR